jgi:hypothetical protein
MRIEAEKKLKRRVVDLRAQRELLLTTLPNTPGIEESLRNIEINASCKKVEL